MTNYYLRPDGACPQPCSSWLHLGKSSAGWAFTFRAYPDRDKPVMDFAAWTELLEVGTIYDEYGRLIERGELLEWIADSQSGLNDPGDIAYLDDKGFRFIPQEFS
jgi:hypothetical protein